MKKILFASLITLGQITSYYSQTITSVQIDQLVEKTLQSFNIPGIAVGIVKDGKLIHAKGYGVRDITTKEKVDENTFFGIASNSKAFTAAALAMLVDEGKLSWDDKVRKFIPNFKLYDPFVTEEFTIRDLLSHRSGMGLGAGDLMMWPDSNNFTRKEIIENLNYLKPTSSFRSKFDYNNNLYIIAGEVVTAVSGLSWEDFIESKIMKPLGMTQSAASISRLKNTTNIATHHAVIESKMQVVPIGWSETANAAGGICANITELSKWVMMQLNHGKFGNDAKSVLFSEAQQNQMWSAVTPLSVKTTSPYNTHYSAYGLGWFLSDVAGKLQVTHTGGLAGMVTQVVLIPELNLGIMVLTNQQVGAAFTAISNTIKDSYLGLPSKDWVKEYDVKMKKFFESAEEASAKVYKKVSENKTTKIDPNSIKGEYTDPWFGQIKISIQNEKIRFNSIKSPRMRGEILFYHANTYIVKWDCRAFDADAFLKFNLDEKGISTGFTMEAFSPITDFSFDFQDLNFTRIK